MLTPYVKNGETFYPFNGSWIQQPIVKDGADYTPVVRLPDANLSDMKVHVVSTSSTTVTLTIQNRGTASINATTPIAFYDGGTTGIPLASSPQIGTSQLVGVDIFPNEKVTLTYTITGNFNDHLVWARIMDDGALFPAVGYQDCDISNNIASGADCPYLAYIIVASPDTLICGSAGIPITLTATPSQTPLYTPTYQWYRNETLITGATNQTYQAMLVGNYTCFVTENICRQFTPVKKLTVKYMEANNDHAFATGLIPTIIDVLQNDSIPATCMPTVTVTENPQNGTVSIVAPNKLSYTADSNFTGMDSLVYAIAPGVTAKVYISVTEYPDNVINAGCYVAPSTTLWSIAEVWKSAYDSVEARSPWFVGDLDGDGKAEIVAFSRSGYTEGSPAYDNFHVFSKIVVFPGDNRDAHVVINPAHPFNQYYCVSPMGLIRANGKGLIVLVGNDGFLRAYEYPSANPNNPTPVWTTPQRVTNDTLIRAEAPSVAFADFNNDGIPEMYAGNKVFNATNGAFLCGGGTGNNIGYSTHFYNGNSYGATFPVAVDINGDGKLELIAGNHAYSVNENAGSWSMSTYRHITPPIIDGQTVNNDGHVSIADFNLDGHPDALVSLVQRIGTNYYIFLYGWDVYNNQILFTASLSGSTYHAKSIPFIGDIDGDGTIEIVVLGNTDLRAYKLPATFGPSATLTSFWNMTVAETNGRTGITLFDFNQDGSAELVYRDEEYLRIIDGTTQTDMGTFPSISGTAWEYPIVADVDNDGAAEIVVAGSAIKNGNVGYMSIYKSSLPEQHWAAARKVWNQYAYNAVNVNEDLTIPKTQLNPATVFSGADHIWGTPDDIRPYNSFLKQQTSLNKYGLPLWLAIDASISGNIGNSYDAAGDSLTITMGITNAGDAAIQPPFYISAYKDSVRIGNCMATDSLMEYIYAGNTKTFELVIHGVSAYFPFTTIIIQLNDKGNAAFIQPECNYGTSFGIEALAEIVMAYNDSMITLSETPVKVAMLKNDSIPASCTNPVITITKQPTNGIAAIVNDSIQYTPYTGFMGIDTVVYSVACGTNIGSAIIRITVAPLKPVSLKYVACPNALAQMGFEPISGITLTWYDAAVAGNLITTGATYTATKDNSSLQSWWVEPVEDGNIFPRYRVDLELSENCGRIAPAACAATGTLVWKEDFGGNLPTDPATRLTGLASDIVSYTYCDTLIGCSTTTGLYVIAKQNPVPNAYATLWYQLNDHTHAGDPTRGYLLAADASAAAGQFYKYQIDGLCAGSNLYFSAWLASLLKIDYTHKANLLFTLEDTGSNVLARYYIGDLPDADPNWKNYGFGFTTPVGLSSLVLRIINNGAGSIGNDFVMDDIEIRFCAPQVTITQPTQADTAVCNGSALTLSGAYIDDGTFANKLVYRWEYSATGDVNNPLAWSVIAGTAGTASGSVNSNYTIPSVSAADKGYYRLVVADTARINTYNCRAMSKVIALTVKNNTPVSIVEKDSICVGTSTLLSPHTGGIWTSNNPAIATVSNVGLVTGVAVGNINFIFTDASTGCLSPTDTVFIQDFPVVEEIIGSNKLCIGAAIQIGNPTTGGVWTINNSNVSINNPIANPVIVTGVSVGNTYITYTVSHGFCQTKKTFHLKILSTTPPRLLIGF
jgi:hypothetical protein